MGKHPHRVDSGRDWDPGAAVFEILWAGFEEAESVCDG